MISGGSPPNGNEGILRRWRRRKRKRRWQWRWQPWQLGVSSSSVTSLAPTVRSGDGDDGAGNHSGEGGAACHQRQRLDPGLGALAGFFFFFVGGRNEEDIHYVYQICVTEQNGRVVGKLYRSMWFWVRIGAATFLG